MLELIEISWYSMLRRVKLKTLFPSLFFGWLALIYLNSVADLGMETPWWIIALVVAFIFAAIRYFPEDRLKSERMRRANSNAAWEHHKIRNRSVQNSKTYLYVVAIQGTSNTKLIKIGIGGSKRLNTQKKRGEIVELIEFESRILAIELERAISHQIAKKRALIPLPVSYPYQDGFSEVYIDNLESRRRIQYVISKFAKKYDLDIS